MSVSSKHALHFSNLWPLQNKVKKVNDEKQEELPGNVVWGSVSIVRKNLPHSALLLVNQIWNNALFLDLQFEAGS